MSIGNVRKKMEAQAVIKGASASRFYQLEIDAVLSFKDETSFVSDRLSEFAQRLSSAKAKNEFIDLASAKKLFLTSKSLLSLCTRDPWADHVPFSLAAIKYFLRDNDSKSDFQVLDGLKDDIEVMMAVVEHFDLKKQIEDEHKRIRGNG